MCLSVRVSLTSLANKALEEKNTQGCNQHRPTIRHLMNLPKQSSIRDPTANYSEAICRVLMTHQVARQSCKDDISAHNVIGVHSSPNYPQPNVISLLDHRLLDKENRKQHSSRILTHTSPDTSVTQECLTTRECKLLLQHHVTMRECPYVPCYCALQSSRNKRSWTTYHSSGNFYSQHFPIFQLFIFNSQSQLSGSKVALSLGQIPFQVGWTGIQTELYHMWQSHVEIEDYSVAYFDHHRITAFKALYRCTSVEGGAHMCFIATRISL